MGIPVRPAKLIELHASVALRRGERGMAEHLLDGADVRTRAEEVRGEIGRAHV